MLAYALYDVEQFTHITSARQAPISQAVLKQPAEGNPHFLAWSCCTADQALDNISFCGYVQQSAHVQQDAFMQAF